MNKLLELLEQDAHLTAAQIAGMLGMDEREVMTAISDYEQKHVILGYKAMVDWDKTDKEIVTALIEVKVAPQRGEGFDRVARRIYQHREVASVYLMSGGFDLMLLIEGRTMKEVALFVAEKLAPMEYITSTATHFVLKKYKDKNVIFTSEDDTDSRAVFV